QPDSSPSNSRPVSVRTAVKGFTSRQAPVSAGTEKPVRTIPHRLPSACRLRLEQHPGTDGSFDAAQLFQRQLAATAVDIDYHVTDILVGLQVLAADVDV